MHRGLDAIGIGLIFPAMPDLMQAVTGRSLSEAALWGGVLATSFAVMQFLCGPLVGNLSDRYGRCPVPLMAQTIWLLLAARIVAGVAAATHPTAHTCVADISSPDQRAKRFGLIGAGFGLGFVAAPMLGGLLAGLLAGIAPRAQSWAAGLGLEVLCYGFYGFASSGFWALVFTPIAALGGITGPALQAMMSRAAPPDQQGELRRVHASLTRWR